MIHPCGCLHRAYATTAGVKLVTEVKVIGHPIVSNTHEPDQSSIKGRSLLAQKDTLCIPTGLVPACDDCECASWWQAVVGVDRAYVADCIDRAIGLLLHTITPILRDV